MALNDRDVSPADLARLNAGRTGGAVTLVGETLKRLNQIAGTDTALAKTEFKAAHEAAVANQA